MVLLVVFQQWCCGLLWCSGGSALVFVGVVTWLRNDAMVFYVEKQATVDVTRTDLRHRATAPWEYGHEHKVEDGQRGEDEKENDDDE